VDDTVHNFSFNSQPASIWCDRLFSVDVLSTRLAAGQMDDYISWIRQPEFGWAHHQNVVSVWLFLTIWSPVDNKLSFVLGPNQHNGDKFVSSHIAWNSMRVCVYMYVYTTQFLILLQVVKTRMALSPRHVTRTHEKRLLVCQFLRSCRL
jgi:hypothetical protein